MFGTYRNMEIKSERYQYTNKRAKRNFKYDIRIWMLKIS